MNAMLSTTKRRRLLQVLVQALVGTPLEGAAPLRAELSKKGATPKLQSSGWRE
jgi:hypothetical protein